MKLNWPSYNMLANKVTIYLDMLGALMEHYILSNADSIGVVNIEWGGTTKKDSKLLSKRWSKVISLLTYDIDQYSAYADDLEIIIYV